jgi:sterol desaturase/sphingolipid hydroxylase (fatty acid hydroxylase superfamily)
MEIIVFVLAVAIVMIAVEIKKPGRSWKKVSGWWVRAFLLNLFQVLSVFIAIFTWDKWFAGISLWSADEVFGVTGAAIFGYLVITFIYYWWHRWRHSSQFLWNHLHQIHHSAQRIEIITAFYKHPAEILINSALSSAILYIGLGMGPESSSLAILLTGLGELVYHWNVKTPYWLGFIFQRPESHCVHHRQGWHRQNFSDIPLWDMLFGTFHNPKDFEGQCGFSDDRETRLTEMLMGKDVLRKP